MERKDMSDIYYKINYEQQHWYLIHKTADMVEST